VPGKSSAQTAPEPADAVVVDELDTVDDGALHTLLDNVAGEHAEEIAMQILTQARANELRVKASSILQRLRAGS